MAKHNNLSVGVKLADRRPYLESSDVRDIHKWAQRTIYGHFNEGDRYEARFEMPRALYNMLEFKRGLQSTNPREKANLLNTPARQRTEQHKIQVFSPSPASHDQRMPQPNFESPEARVQVPQGGQAQGGGAQTAAPLVSRHSQTPQQPHVQGQEAQVGQVLEARLRDIDAAVQSLASSVSQGFESFGLAVTQAIAAATKSLESFNKQQLAQKEKAPQQERDWPLATSEGLSAEDWIISLLGCWTASPQQLFDCLNAIPCDRDARLDQLSEIIFDRIEAFDLWCRAYEANPNVIGTLEQQEDNVVKIFLSRLPNFIWTRVRARVQPRDLQAMRQLMLELVAEAMAQPEEPPFKRHKREPAAGETAAPAQGGTIPAPAPAPSKPAVTVAAPNPAPKPDGRQFYRSSAPNRERGDRGGAGSGAGYSRVWRRDDRAQAREHSRYAPLPPTHSLDDSSAVPPMPGKVASTQRSTRCCTLGTEHRTHEQPQPAGQQRWSDCAGYVPGVLTPLDTRLDSGADDNIVPSRVAADIFEHADPEDCTLFKLPEVVLVRDAAGKVLGSAEETLRFVWCPIDDGRFAQSAYVLEALVLNSGEHGEELQDDLIIGEDQLRLWGLLKVEGWTKGGEQRLLQEEEELLDEHDPSKDRVVPPSSDLLDKEELRKKLHEAANSPHSRRACAMRLADMLVDEFPEVVGVQPPDRRPFSNPKRQLKLRLKMGCVPRKTAQRRLSDKKKRAAMSKVNDWLRKGYIQKTLRFGSPMALHCAKKGEDDVRVCLDGTPLNDVTEPMHFPLPLPQDLVAKVANSHCITVIDAKNGFLQFELHVDGRGYVCFFGPDGAVYRFYRVPFGLQQATAFFQSQMEDILVDLPHVFVYIDDIIVHTPSEEGHADAVRAVLGRLRKAGLVLNAEKCQLAKSQVQYLGRMVGSGEHGLLEAKHEELLQVPQPVTAYELQRWLGLVAWVQDYFPGIRLEVALLDQLARPAGVRTKAQAKKCRLQWTQEHQQAWLKARIHLARPTKLHAIDPDLPIHLFTDGSNAGVGGMLCQRPEGKKRAIGFFSKAFARGSAESNWTTTEKELFAIVVACSKWRHVLLGRPIVVHTDHLNLTYLEHESASSKVQRWRRMLQEFQINWLFIKGEDNVCADLLSRHVPLEDKEQGQRRVCKVTTRAQRAQQGQQQATVQSKEDQVNLIPEALLPPKDDHRQLLQWVHGGTIGHRPASVTLELLKSLKLGWPGMEAEVQRFVDTCTVCQACKDRRGRKIKESGKLSELASTPFTHLAVDVVHLLEDEEGYKFATIITDAFTKLTHIVPSRKDNAREAAAAILQWCSLYGLPLSIRTDGSTSYDNHIISHLLQGMGIAHHFAHPYFHESNGQAERAIREVQRKARYLLMDRALRPQEWRTVIPLVQRQLNSSISFATGFSPATLAFGGTVNLDRLLLPEPSEGVLGDKRPRETGGAGVLQGWMAQVKAHQEVLCKAALEFKRERLRKAQRGAYIGLPPKDLPPGSFVWVQYPQARRKEMPSWMKLLPASEGPYRVKEWRSSASTCLLEDVLVEGRQFEVHHNYTYKADLSRMGVDGDSKEQLERLAAAVKGQHVVDSVLEHDDNGHPHAKSLWEFRVLWKGFPKSEATWEPYAHVKRTLALEQYARRHNLTKLL